MNEDLNEKIQKVINKARGWIFIRSLLHWAGWCLIAAVALAALLELAACFLPFYRVHWFAAGSIAGGLLAALIIALVRFPTGLQAARALDATGLKERTATALELKGEDSLLAELQKADAWEHLKDIRVSRSLPLRPGRKRPLVLLLLTSFLIVCVIAPTASKEEALRIHALSESKKDPLDQVEEAEKELQEKVAVSEEELEEYQELLAQIRKELQEAKSEEELQKALDRAGLKLSEAADKSQTEEAQKSLNQLASALGGQEQGGKSTGTDAKTQRQQEAAAQAEELLSKAAESAAENGDLSALSEEELQALQKALEELTGDGESQLSAEDLASLQELADQLADGQKLSADQLASAAATAGALQKQLAQNTASAQSSSGTGGGSGSGNGNGSSKGSGNGGGWNTGSNVGQQKEESYNGEMVSIPNETGDDANLTGSPGEGDSYLSEGGAALTWSGEQVTYDQVIGEYSSQAMTQIENSDYPSAMQDLIRSYFKTIQGN